MRKEVSDPSDKQATRVEEGQTPKKRKEQEVQDEGVPRETSSDDDDEGEEEGDEDDGYDSAEDCWRCRDDMCFKHALRGIKGAKVTEVEGSGGSMFSVSFPTPDETPPNNVPNGELEFNDAGPPQDGIPVRMDAQEGNNLKRFLEYNSNTYPPTRVKQDDDGTKYRVYCYPGSVISLMQQWAAEWQEQQKGS